MSCDDIASTSCAAGSACSPAPYHDALVRGQVARPEAAIKAVTRVHASLESMERNPNETLLLQALLLDLPSL